MIKKLKYNYKLDTEQGLLFKHEKESNLYWSIGGYPLIDYETFLKHRENLRYIGVKTEKRKFVIPKQFFDKHTIVEHKGFGKQVQFDPFFWTITKLTTLL